MKTALLTFALACLPLVAQEPPAPNRLAWLAIFPEPLPDGQARLSLEATSQFLRLDFQQSPDGRSRARLDGEEWQLTGDLPWPVGPGILNLRVRAVHRGGGIGDSSFEFWHRALGTQNGGREEVPMGRLDYHLERDGVVLAHLDRPGLHLMDLDLAYLIAWGSPALGARVGASLQLPTGRRKDFSGSGGLDGTLGVAGWKSLGAWRLHGQAERVLVGLPTHSPYRAVLTHRSFNRLWAGVGFQGEGPGFWRGLGVDVSLAYSASPYQVGISRIDRAGWQQHWTLTHRALPKAHFTVSEEAGTYAAPDLTLAFGYRF